VSFVERLFIEDKEEKVNKKKTMMEFFFIQKTNRITKRNKSIRRFRLVESHRFSKSIHSMTQTPPADSILAFIVSASALLKLSRSTWGTDSTSFLA
jgi:hypothetical protein